MAILGLDSLTGCNSIPDFIATGTRMIFNATAAPTSWTKDTVNYNGHALRIVTGTVSSGGSTGFAVVFANTQRSVQVSSVGNGADSIGIQPATIALSINQEPVTVSSNNFTSIAESLATHTHVGVIFPGDANPGPVAPPTNRPVVARGGSNLSVLDNTASPANAQHNHQFPAGTSLHNHTTNNTEHTHPSVNSSSHSHTITVGSQDFAVSYYDVIIASKN